jgi:peptide/nickel transport system permease protein
MLGVIVLVFILFQGFADPSRLVMGQRADAATQENIRRELYLDQPKWRQFALYINDLSPIAVHSDSDIVKKQLKGFFVGSGINIGVKLPYLRRSYQTKKNVGEVLLEALPGTLLLAIAAMCIAIVIGIPLGVLAAVKKDTWMDTGAIFTSIWVL